MKRNLMLRAILQASFIAAFANVSVHADVSLTFSRAASADDTSLTIFGVGSVEATSDSLLSFSSNGSDTFIVADTPNQAPAIISPNIELDDQTLSLDFLGDFNGGGQADPESFIRFTFRSRTGLVDLGDLSGDYILQGVPFSSFVPGSYSDLRSERNTRSLSAGALSVTVVSVPEPSTLCLLGIAAIHCATRRRRSKARVPTSMIAA